MSKQSDDLFDESIEMVQRYGKCLVKDSNPDTESEFEELSPVMMSLCNARDKYLTTKDVFSGYVAEIEDSEEVDIDEIIEMFKKDVGKAISALELGDKNKTYLEFKQSLLAEKNSLDDSEIATVSEAINTIDPITKLTLTDPVKNIKCGHVYEQASILHLIGRNKIVKCPIPGCIAADRVRKDDLVPDLALKRYLENIKKS